MQHTNITFNSNGTMSTNPMHPLVWQEHMSAGNSEDDILVLPNIALLVSANYSCTTHNYVRNDRQRNLRSDSVSLAGGDICILKGQVKRSCFVSC